MHRWRSKKTRWLKVSTNKEASTRLALLDLKLHNGKDARTWHASGHFLY